MLGGDYTVRNSEDAFARTRSHVATKEALVKQKTPEGTPLFARLVCEHKKAVFAVAYAKLRNVHDAEDVMQEVFIEAYRNFKRMRNPEKIRTWLHKATIYRCKDHIREAVRRKKREHIFAESASNNPSGGTQIEAERRDSVLQAIGLLPEEYRVVVMLKHFAGLSYADISKMTGFSKTAIGNRLQVARKKLKRTLFELGEGVD